MRTAISFALFILCSFQPAFADWVGQSASYRCDKQRSSFSLRPIANTNSGEAIALAPGFIQIPNGYKGSSPDTIEVRCNLPGAKVNASLYSRSGTIQVTVHVNGLPLIEHELFNSGMDFSPVLYQVDILSQGKTHAPKVVLCRGNWNWTENYKGGSCERTTLSSEKP